MKNLSKNNIVKWLDETGIEASACTRKFSLCLYVVQINFRWANRWVQSSDSAKRSAKIFAERFAESESKTSLHFLD